MALAHSTAVIAVAQALLAARRDRTPCDATAFDGQLNTPADAYAVQAQVLQALDAGAPAVARHWKSGAPSPTATSTHAPLPSGGVWSSPAKASDWPFNIRIIEVEIALRFGRDVTPAQAAQLTAASATELVDAMAVAIELVDSRWQQNIHAPALLKLADLQSHGALVLGTWQPFVARDWAAQAGSVQIGAQPAQPFRGTHTMGDPVAVLPAWLRHLTQGGHTVPAGTVVTTGTWCGMPAAAAGDRVVARFDGLGETVVQL